MIDNEFRLLLEAAVCGDRKALDSLLALYMPLINRLSSYAGNLDEDCRQYIMLVPLAASGYPFGLAGQSQEHINTDGNRMRDDPPGAIMILP